MKYILAAATLALGAFCANAETPRLQKTLPDGRTVTVEAVTDNIIKVTNAAAGARQLPTVTALEADTDADARITVAGDLDLLITSAGVTATLNPANGEVTINAGAGKVVTDPGTRAIADGKQALTLSTPRAVLITAPASAATNSTCAATHW